MKFFAYIFAFVCAIFALAAGEPLGRVQRSPTPDPGPDPWGGWGRGWGGWGRRWSGYGGGYGGYGGGYGGYGGGYGRYYGGGGGYWRR